MAHSVKPVTLKDLTIRVNSPNFRWVGKPLIYVVDDDPMVLQSLEMALEGRYAVVSFSGAESAEKQITRKEPALLLLDLNLPRKDGLFWLQRWTSLFPSVPIVFISGELNVSRVVECHRQGARDFVCKPIRPNDLHLVVEKILRSMPQEETSTPTDATLIGVSEPMSDLKSKMRLLRGQHHVNVLVLGETGTGKELVARELHAQEKRTKRPWIVVNTPGIPVSLMESELFGVEKGAFTDAVQSRPGKFELAHEGDIFLDEIADLPVDTQAKILRVLQDKRVERVGSNLSKETNFRVLSATNQSLAQLSSKKKFREDLLFRLSDMVLWVPALRDRKEDIPCLADHFLRKYSQKKHYFHEEAMKQLMNYDWPGNVRQLESCIKRTLIYSKAEEIRSVEILDPMLLAPQLPKPLSFDEQMRTHEKNLFKSILDKHQGNRVKAMADLGLPRTTFYRKLQQFGLV